MSKPAHFLKTMLLLHRNDKKAGVESGDLHLQTAGMPFLLVVKNDIQERAVNVDGAVVLNET